MVDGKMERPELRAYLKQLFNHTYDNLSTALRDTPEEENGASNLSMRECLEEMQAVVADLLDKVRLDVRLKDTRTCEECFEDFNDSGRVERFCSDSCEEKYNDEIEGEDDERDLEDDCT